MKDTNRRLSGWQLYVAVQEQEEYIKHDLFVGLELLSFYSRKSQVRHYPGKPAPPVTPRGIFNVIDVEGQAHAVSGFAMTADIIAYVVYNHGTGANDLLLFSPGEFPT